MAEELGSYEIFKAGFFTNGQLNTLSAIFFNGLTERKQIADYYDIDEDTVKVTLYRQNLSPKNASEKGIFGIVEEETGIYPSNLVHAIVLLVQSEIVRLRRPA